LSRLFISHSSKDNVPAIAFKQWLGANGWAADDVFLDLDSIGAGERWKEALRKANARCEAVVLLASPDALASPECIAEVRKAEDFGKEIIVVLLHDLQVDDHRLISYKERQIVDLAAPPQSHIQTVDYRGESHLVRFNEDSLARVRDFLVKRGITPDSFAWPPQDRPNAEPFPGLSAFSEEDAGIFFGRDADILRGLDKLRVLRRNGRPRLLVIQAASGAGKSSYLRAGLWPRLDRDPDFAPVAIVRPAQGILTGPEGVGRRLAVRLSRPGRILSPGEIHASLKAQDSAIAANAFVELMTQAASLACDERRVGVSNRRTPVLVIGIDQAEELFAADDAAESERFLFLMASVMRRSMPELLCVFTVRSDGAARLFQAIDDLELEIPETLPLLPLPQSAYRDVILKPLDVLARRGNRLTLNPLLADRLVADATGADALPLLAFTISHLYREFGATGSLTSEQYDVIGGISGAIDMALKRALAKPADEPAIPTSREEQLGGLKAAFIPWLARIDPETGTPMRRVARLNDFPQSSRAMVERLIKARLLVADRRSGADVVEIAHESLLRQWSTLTAWLQADADDLKLIDGIQRAAREWEANGRDETWLVHSGRRLDEAQRISDRSDVGAVLSSTERAYLRECWSRELGARLAEQRRLARERRNLRLARWALAALFLGVMAALGATLWQSYRTSRSEAAVFASAGATASQQGFCDRSLRFAIAGLPSDSGAFPIAYTSPELQGDLSLFLSALSCRFRAVLGGHGDIVTAAKFSPDGNRIVTASGDNTARVWDATTGTALVTLSGHGGKVWNADFSRDGSRIVTASWDGTARIWNATSGELLKTLSGHMSVVLSAVFSPDGNRIVTTSSDDTARLWDAAAGSVLAVLVGHTDTVQTAAFSPDGNRIVTASDDHTARLWDARTGAPLAKLTGHSNYVLSAAFSPDGTRIVTASADTTARLWDADSGAAIATLSGHTRSVDSAVFSPDGSHVVTASSDGTARVWDGKKGDPLSVLVGHMDSVFDANFSSDGSRVVTASADRTARMWDAQKGAELVRLVGHTDSVVRAAFSPHGDLIATASRDHTARLWHGRADTAFVTLSGDTDKVVAAVFSPDGNRVLTASNDQTARLWDANSGAILTIFTGHTNWVTGAAFSPEGNSAVTSSFDKTARVWDAKSGSLLATLSGHTDWLFSALYSPDGTRIVTGSRDKTARLWDGRSGNLLAVLSGHEGSVNSAVFSPDGARVATASADGTARLWDVASGAAVVTLSGHTDLIYGVSFSPNGDRLVTASEDKTARLWDVRTATALAELSGHTKEVFTANFSPDGEQVVTASADNTARVWDTKTGDVIAVLSGHTDGVLRAVFSADGRRVVTASADGTARLWDARTGAILSVFSGHTDQVESATLSPDGARIVTASHDKTARIWRIDSASLMPADQRQQYICRERLTGAQSFSDGEMDDPILRGRDDLKNPCDRRGPLSLGYYEREVGSLWRALQSVFARIIGERS
jgi:WD40 repeat protein